MVLHDPVTRFLLTSKRYLRLLFERFKTRGLIAGAFAVLAFAASVVWVVFDYDKPDPWVNLFSLLSLVFAALAAVFASMQSRIEGDYSLCFALAHGYVNNFVKYVLENLENADERPPEGGALVIFRPVGLDELDDASVEAYKATLSGRGYLQSVKVLKPVGKRARDVFVIQGQQGLGEKLRYVDFPSTLLTLRSLIDYRSDVQEADTGLAMSEKQRQLIAEDLIDCFFREIARMLAPEITKGQILFTNSLMRNL